MRQHAAQWSIKPDRVGIMGFSAGDLVALGAAMGHDFAGRPDFEASIYGPPFGDPTVPGDTPPLFILCASDDQAEAGCARLYSAWRDAARRRSCTSTSRESTGSG